MTEQVAAGPIETSPQKPLAWLLELFLMRRRFAELRAQGLSLENPGFAACALAYSLLRDAHQLSSSSAGSDTALVLYRSALRLLVYDRELQASSAATAPGQVPPARAEEQAASPALTAVLAENGEARLATLSRPERESLLVELRNAAQRLADARLGDVLRERRLRWARRFRLLALGSVLALGLFCLWRLANPQNLALNRPVVTSSRDPTWGVPPRQLVDGDQLNVGFHTTNEANATATIDLGEVESLDAIEIFNRPDCCQDRAVPLSVQLSSDGKNYVTVEHRVRVFYRWRIELPSGTRARFVRVKHEASGFFHLSEIEVF
jgi:hypothetical protein